MTPGGTDYQAYYDDVLDVTWLADANLAATNTFGVAGIFSNGTMSWDKAIDWIAALNDASYLGAGDWRLPKVTPLNGIGFLYDVSYDGSTDYGFNQSAPDTAFAGSTGSEMAHLFFNTLGNKGYCDPLASTLDYCANPQPGWGLTNAGPFVNLNASYYWSGTAYPFSTPAAWDFSFGPGAQDITVASQPFNTWAVRSGDIAVVPAPPALWLLGSALGATAWVRRKVIG